MRNGPNAHQGYLGRTDFASGIFTSWQKDLENHNSFAYKRLITLLVYVKAEEMTIEDAIQMAIAEQALEEKHEENEKEVESLKENEKETQQAIIAKNEQIKEEQEQAAKQTAEKVAEDLHRKMTEHVENIKQLDTVLYNYEESKKDFDQRIDAIDKEIEPLEKEWREDQAKIADAFVKDNFELNDNGKYVTKKEPFIELLNDAVNVIKNIFSQGKSPAEMQVHNPTLLDHPERVPLQDHVRVELNMAKKIDKIVDKKFRKEANKDRKVIVKRVVLDESGNPVFEVDANGKKKVKTERVELDPLNRQEGIAKKDMAGNESSTSYATAESSLGEGKRIVKKKQTQLVCVGDVCFVADKLIDVSLSDSAKPINDSQQHRELTQSLLEKGEEKRPLVNQRDNLIDMIEQTKAEIEVEKKAVDEAYAQLVDMHQAPHIASPLSMQPTPASGERILEQAKKVADLPDPTKNKELLVSAKKVADAVKTMIESSEEKEEEKPSGPRPGRS